MRNRLGENPINENELKERMDREAEFELISPNVKFTEQFDEFVRLTNEYVAENLNKVDFLPTKSYDFNLDENEITLKLVEDIDRLEPCGHMNARPIFNFKLKNAVVSSLPKHPQHLVLAYPNFNLFKQLKLATKIILLLF